MDYSWFVILNGAIYVLVAVLTIPLHIIVAMSIYKTGAVRKRITLRILLSLSFAGVVQLLFQGIGGLYICIGVPLDDIFNNVMGFAMNGLWGVTLIQHVTLALNRLKVVTSKTLVREEEFKYFDTSIVVSWIWGIFYTCSYCIGGYHNLYFDAANLNWANRGEGTTTIIRFWFYFRLVALIAGITASMIVIASLIINRQKISNGNNRLITGRDLRLFIQTTIVFILAITHVGTWNLAPNPDIYLLSILNLEWVLVCALLPYLNLAMSSDIRNSLLRVLRLKKSTVNSSGPPMTAFTVYKTKAALTKVSG